METRERNHALANLHGSARQLAWLDFATCMVQLSEVHGSAFVVAWMDSKSPILASKITLAICRKSPPCKNPGLRTAADTIAKAHDAPAIQLLPGFAEPFDTDDG